MALQKAKPRKEVADPSPHKRARRMRDYEVDRLVSQYKKTRNMREVSRQFRMSRDTVAKHLASRGIDTSNRMKPADIKKAKELYAQGMGSGRIGKQLGFDNKTILKAVQITLEDTGRQKS